MGEEKVRSRISKLVYNSIKDIFNKRCYPIVAELTTIKPFSVYKIDSQRPDYTKDGIYEWVHSVNIKIVCDKYDDLLDYTDRVINAINGIEVDDMSISQITEDYIDDEYVCDVDVEFYT